METHYSITKKDLLEALRSTLEEGLKKMKRLTEEIRNYDGTGVSKRSIYVLENFRVQLTDHMVSILTKLADYEDTGLDPKEIEGLKERDTAKVPIDADEDYGFFTCPSCGETIYASDNFESHKFCLNCGQRIKWEE